LLKRMPSIRAEWWVCREQAGEGHATANRNRGGGTGEVDETNTHSSKPLPLSAAAAPVPPPAPASVRGPALLTCSAVACWCCPFLCRSTTSWFLALVNSGALLCSWSGSPGLPASTSGASGGLPPGPHPLPPPLAGCPRRAAPGGCQDCCLRLRRMSISSSLLSPVTMGSSLLPGPWCCCCCCCCWRWAAPREGPGLSNPRLGGLGAPACCPAAEEGAEGPRGAWLAAAEAEEVNLGGGGAEPHLLAAAATTPGLEGVPPPPACCMSPSMSIGSLLTCSQQALV
jgi:hypothetical protein